VSEKSLFLAEKIKFAVKKIDLLSILIPIYNYNGIKLVTDLQAQAMNLGIEFEIIVADDHSPKPVQANEAINHLAFARYVYLPKNMGRSGSRNWLAQNAQYDYLLFIDGDMGVRSDDFLRKYLDVLAENRVVCGGHFYDETPPDDAFLLHWSYGRSREVRTAQVRNQSPYEGFVPSNFVIPREVFKSIRFDEGIKGYGHEDTLFGEMLQKMKVEVLHIDNGLVHLGLSTNIEFMDKVDVAVKNLRFLEEKYQFTGTRLQQTAKKLEILRPLFRLIPKSFLRKWVMSGQLWLLDFYKILVYFE